jgi:hypothetical protein
MAFEEQQTPPPPKPLKTPRKRSFDPPAFLTAIFVILIIAGLLFLFRDPIANFFARWQNDTPPVAIDAPPPLPTVMPAPDVTPTPAPTPAPTPTPGTVAPPVGTPPPVMPGNDLPQSGPGNIALATLMGGMAAGAAYARHRYYAAKAKRAAQDIDIA